MHQISPHATYDSSRAGEVRSVPAMPFLGLFSVVEVTKQTAYPSCQSDPGSNSSRRSILKIGLHTNAWMGVDRDQIQTFHHD